MGGHPILLDGFGMVVLPVAEYLHERAAWLSFTTGTIVADAFVLQSWWGYLQDLRVDWRDACDEHLREWCRVKVKAGNKNARIRYSLGVVFRFYYMCQTQFKLISNVIQDPLSPDGGGSRITVTVNTVIRKDGRRETVFRPRFRVPRGAKSRKRPTPSGDEVSAILDSLLDNPNFERGYALWLCASWMYRAGLRREGVSRLTLGNLSDAILKSCPNLKGHFKVLDLDLVSKCIRSQRLIRSDLQKLVSLGRREIGVLVTEKGGKERFAPTPIDFIDQNLMYIWGERAALVEMMRNGKRRTKACDALILSLKTGRGLGAKAISNAIHIKFKKLNIKGSPHRIRAAFGEMRTRETYYSARAEQGLGFEPIAVLLSVAEAMGHERLSSLWVYLHQIIKEGLFTLEHPICVRDKLLAKIVRAIALEINKGNLAIIEDVSDVLTRHGLSPLPEPGEIDSLRWSAKLLEKRAAAGSPAGLWSSDGSLSQLT